MWQSVRADHVAESRLIDGGGSEQCWCLFWSPTKALRDSVDIRSHTWFKHHCGSCVRNESMLRFVCVVGLSVAVFPFHLHGSDNNKWAGRFEIRLRDPQLQRKKELTPMCELLIVAPF